MLLWLPWKRKKFQSTPSWRGRLSFSMIVCFCHIISIHALVKRATCNRRNSPMYTEFQSTPSWRGRLIFASCSDRWSYFNPRPREEGDRKGKTLVGLFRISIHALVKRATLSSSFNKWRSYLFQSTPSWRGRRLRVRKKSKIYTFQSTPSWRGRPSAEMSGQRRKKFQSTPSWRGRRYCR